MLFEGPGSSAYFRSVLTGRMVDPPVVMRCYSTESVRSAVGNGLGFSLTVMRPASGLSYDGHEIVTVPIADDVPPLDVVLASTVATASSELIGSFESFCRELFRRLV